MRIRSQSIPMLRPVPSGQWGCTIDNPRHKRRILRTGEGAHFLSVSPVAVAFHLVTRIILPSYPLHGVLPIRHIRTSPLLIEPCIQPIHSKPLKSSHQSIRDSDLPLLIPITANTKLPPHHPPVLRQLRMIERTHFPSNLPPAHIQLLADKDDRCRRCPMVGGDPIVGFDIVEY